MISIAQKSIYQLFIYPIFYMIQRTFWTDEGPEKKVKIFDITDWIALEGWQERFSSTVKPYKVWYLHCIIRTEGKFILFPKINYIKLFNSPQTIHRNPIFYLQQETVFASNFKILHIICVTLSIEYQNVNRAYFLKK